MANSTVASDSLLDHIKCPRDLRTFRPDALPRLASEVRSYLLETIPRVGGHFGSNLGNVELTIALHYAFHSPHDAIVWDVSHGCYPHKILTGRRDLTTLRQSGGLSGFLSPAESEHDLAATGHAGTGLSTALGIAWARRYAGVEGRVVLVVGDGALPSGMTLEALNNASSLGVDLTIVLNDNQQSIDPTPGALTRILRKPREGSLRCRFFEDFGLRFVGPVDGHDLPFLAEILAAARLVDGISVIHAVTTKGKGCAEAEADPNALHAVSPSSPGGAPSFSAVFGAELVELAARDPRIVAISAGMIGGTGLKEFRKRFPDRCFDVGICEEHGVTFAAGLSLQGLRPVVAIYSTFLQRAYDQIVHDVCIPGLPVIFALDRAGCVGPDGATHHGLFDLSYLRSIPNMKVLAPSSAQEMKNHLRAALADGGPVALRYPRGTAPDDPTAVDLGTPFAASRKLRAGQDAAVLVTGNMVPVVLEAADLLALQGITLEVVEARSVKPLDEDAVREVVRRHSLVFTLEDHVTAGGFGGAVSELLSDHAGARLKILGWPDEFVQHGSVKELREQHGLDARNIAGLVQQLVEEERAPPREAARRQPVLIVEPEEAASLMREVADVELDEQIQQVCRDYDRVGQRDGFLWKWVQRGLELTSLSCVRADLRNHVRDTKLIGVMFDVLLDDVADNWSAPAFLGRLISITASDRRVSAGSLTPHKKEYLDFAEHVWALLWKRVERYPRHPELREILQYDYDQLMNVMRYSTLVNARPRMMNIVEHDSYLPHNMHMMVSATIDLMASPSFDLDELGALREIVWDAQQMGRIGNMLTTWERELDEGDFTSGIFALGLSQGVLALQDLMNRDSSRVLEKIEAAQVEAFFLERWKKLHDGIVARARTIRTVDVMGLADGLRRLIRLHLASRGLK